MLEEKMLSDFTAEQFLRRFPEFKPLLEDPELSEDFLVSALAEAKTLVLNGEWDAAIRLDLIFLHTANMLQERFEQQAISANLAVQASKGDGKGNLTKPSLSTSYKVRIERLIEQNRIQGGILV